MSRKIHTVINDIQWDLSNENLVDAGLTEEVVLKNLPVQAELVFSTHQRGEVRGLIARTARDLLSDSFEFRVSSLNLHRFTVNTIGINEKIEPKLVSTVRP